MAATLQFRLTGGAANSDPDLSLGGDMSSTQVSGTALNNLFDNVSEVEASAGDIEYRAIDIYESGGADDAESCEIWIDDETASSDSNIDIALDAGTQSVGNENTAPSAPSLSFTHNLSGSPLSIGTISAGTAQRLWIRRTIDSSATNHANDLCGLTVRFA